ncbi:MAG: ATP-binding protein, partial [Salinivirgaceae bacterium]|nr:ATP-binding protein [Salinivirgaceae bacterium]
MKKSDNPLEQEPFKSHSAKLKRVFIELHDYTFSHGTTDASNSEDRFIGRERELKRFQSTLTNSSKKSGIYLITGYRGMGKTSFVKKALDALYKPSAPILAFLKWVKSLFLLFFLLVFIFIIHKLTTNGKLNDNNITDTIEFSFFLSFIIFIILFVILLWTIIRNNKILIKEIKKSDLLIFFKNILNKIYFNQIKDTNSKHIYYLEYFTTLSFFASLIAFVSFIVVNYFKINMDIFKIVRFEFLLLTGFIFLFFIFYISYWFYLRFEPNKTDSNNKNKLNTIIFDDFLKPILKFFNHSQTITINLNLGYSNLSEINILKLIARNVKSNFDHHRKIFSINKLFWIIIFIAVVFFTCSIYSTNTVKSINNFVKNALSLNVLFPSQNDLFLNDDHNELNRIVVGMD